MLRSVTFPLEFIKRMIELGVDPHYDNDMPFIVSCRNKTIDVPLYFINEYHVDVNVQNGSAAQFCNLDILKMLLDHGLKITKYLINRSINNLNTIELIKLLRAYGANLQELLECCSGNINKINSNETIYFLIEEIAKTNEIIYSKVINVFFVQVNVVTELTIEQIKILVGAGANLRCDNDHPFLCSCKHGNIKTFFYFLHECNVDINSHNSDALQIAIKFNSYEIANFLLESGIKITDEAIKMCFSDMQYLQLLINNDVGMERIAKLYMNLLISSQPNSLSSLKCAKLLIRSGIDFNQYILNSNDNDIIF